MPIDPSSLANLATQGAAGLGAAVGGAMPLDPYRRELGANHAKWLSKVLNGEMTPQEAATRHRMELAGHPAAFAGLPTANDSGASAAGPQGAPPPPGGAPQAPSAQAASPAPAPPPPGPSAPPQGPSPETPLPPEYSIPAPQTGHQYDTLNQFSAEMRPSLQQASVDRRLQATLAGKAEGRTQSLDTRREIEEMKEGGRKERAGAALENKKSEFSQTLKLRTDALRQEYDLTLAKLKTQLSMLEKRQVSTKDIQYANLLLKQLGQVQAGLSKEITSDASLAKDPTLTADLDRKLREVQAIKAELEPALERARKNAGAGASTTTKTTVSSPTRADLDKALGK